MFEKRQDMISRLARRSPENTTLQDERAWFDQEIAAQKQ
jgi:hypothetical protein